MPSLLPGDLESGQAYMLRGDFEPMAQKKLKNMLEYHSVYPEFSHVFVCDNGQADVRAAELMKERLGTSIEAVFCHQVQPLDKTFGFTEQSLEKWRKMGIIFYNTFVGAATDACERGLIETAALREICFAANEEFVDLYSNLGFKFPGGLFGVELKRLELVADFNRANVVLERNGFLPVPPPRALCIFPIGSTVFTQYFGEGFVRTFRPGDGIYEISLLNGNISGYFNAIDLNTTRKAQRFFPGNLPPSLHLVPVGSKVSTPYGEGVVRRYRPSDKIFEVILTKWPALAFLKESDVETLESRSTKIWGLGKAFIKRTLSNMPAQQPRSVLPSQQQQPVFEIGSQVQVSGFGSGIVVHFREEDNIAIVRFEHIKATGYIHISSLSSSSKKITSLSGIPALVMNRVFGGGLKVGTTVETPFSKGSVIQEERTDGIIKVKLEWGADGYFNKKSVKKDGMTSRILSMLSRDSPKNSLKRNKSSSFSPDPSPSPSPELFAKKSFLFSVGDIVSTNFGIAKVEAVRIADSVSYQVSFLNWKGKGFLQADQIFTYQPPEDAEICRNNISN